MCRLWQKAKCGVLLSAYICPIMRTEWRIRSMGNNTTKMPAMSAKSALAPTFVQNNAEYVLKITSARTQPRVHLN